MEISNNYSTAKVWNTSNKNVSKSSKKNKWKLTDSLKEKIIKENLIRDKVLNEFRVNRKLISSTLLNELDLDFGDRVRGILGLNFYKKNTEDLLTYYSYVNIHGVFELEYHYSNNYKDTCGLD